MKWRVRCEYDYSGLACRGQATAANRPALGSKQSHVPRHSHQLSRPLTPSGHCQFGMSAYQLDSLYEISRVRALMWNAPSPLPHVLSHLLYVIIIIVIIAIIIVIIIIIIIIILFIIIISSSSSSCSSSSPRPQPPFSFQRVLSPLISSLSFVISLKPTAQCVPELAEDVTALPAFLTGMAAAATASSVAIQVHPVIVQTLPPTVALTRCQ